MPLICTQLDNLFIEYCNHQAVGYINTIRNKKSNYILI